MGSGQVEIVLALCPLGEKVARYRRFLKPERAGPSPAEGS